jgi:hypothetical protein
VNPLDPATENFQSAKVPEPLKLSVVKVMEVFGTIAVITPSLKSIGEAVLAALTLVPIAYAPV